MPGNVDLRACAFNSHGMLTMIAKSLLPSYWPVARSRGQTRWQLRNGYARKKNGLDIV